MSDPKNRSKTMSNSHNTDVEEDPQNSSTVTTTTTTTTTIHDNDNNNNNNNNNEKQKLKDDVKEKQRQVFSCSICLGLMHKPVTLLCGHTYCRHCITFSVNLRVKGTADDPKQCQCPLCRQPMKILASEFQTNVILWDMIKEQFPHEALQDEDDKDKAYTEQKSLLLKHESERNGTLHVTNDLFTDGGRYVNDEELVTGNGSLSRIIRNDIDEDNHPTHQWSLAFTQFPNQILVNSTLRFQVALLIMEEDEVTDGGFPKILRSAGDRNLRDHNFTGSFHATIIMNNSIVIQQIEFQMNHGISTYINFDSILPAGQYMLHISEYNINGQELEELIANNLNEAINLNGKLNDQYIVNMGMRLNFEIRTNDNIMPDDSFYFGGRAISDDDISSSERGRYVIGGGGSNDDEEDEDDDDDDMDGFVVDDDVVEYASDYEEEEDDDSEEEESYTRNSSSSRSRKRSTYDGSTTNGGGNNNSNKRRKKNHRVIVIEDSDDDDDDDDDY